MNKKAIAILGAIFLLIVGTLGFLIFQRRSSGEEVADGGNPGAIVPDPTPDPFVNPDPTPNPNPSPTPTPDPVEFGNSPTRLSSELMVSPILFYRGNGVAYFSPDGRLFQASFRDASGSQQLTNLQELAVPAKQGITKVIWPQNGNNFLVEIGSGGAKTWSVYVSNKGEYVDVPKEVVSLGWLPDGQQLLYFWLGPDGKATMNVSPADLSTWNAVVDLWETDNEMSVAPDGKTVLYWRGIASGEVNSINMVTADGKLFRSVVKDGFNYRAVWSPDSRLFAFNRLVNGRVELWIGNMFTGQVISTGLETSTEKITWSIDGKALFAAVNSVAEGYDQLYFVDATNGQSTIKPVAGGMGFAENLFLSLDGTRLYYWDRVNLGLFYLDVNN